VGALAFEATRPTAGMPHAFSMHRSIVMPTLGSWAWTDGPETMHTQDFHTRVRCCASSITLVLAVGMSYPGLMVLSTWHWSTPNIYTYVPDFQSRLPCSYRLIVIPFLEKQAATYNTGLHNTYRWWRLWMHKETNLQVAHRSDCYQVEVLRALDGSRVRTQIGRSIRSQL
jgi:hypothetical protein